MKVMVKGHGKHEDGVHGARWWLPVCTWMALIGLALLLEGAFGNPPIAAEEPGGRQPNWTSPDLPCARFDDLRKRVIGNSEVRIDAPEPWAGGLPRALRFWNTVLTADFHEESDLKACSVRIIEGDQGILSGAVAARSQFTNAANFRRKIAVSRTAAKDLTSGEIYAVAVHEIGHMLGLNHSASSRSVMYFLDVRDTGGPRRRRHPRATQPS